jgi:DNA polymerase-3 subunit alpha
MDEIESDSEILDDLPMQSIKTEVEEVRKVTSLEMKSRKLRVKITKELLEELDKLDVRFRLN